ncbi:hypothetical protein FLONG3_10452 [Fusarium longipes]|uniref:Uncharacterized protein n=1 Tax=Fusarium longipes TaxID=694270 RepID=A0A395RNF0_9HYPO|nr:hypothetical protein FLONG3_10452 [Fusarium longipes]
MSLSSGKEPPENLDELASLCLCGYHQGQVQEVVQRWKLYIRNATEHHENLVRSSSDMEWISKWARQIEQLSNKCKENHIAVLTLALKDEAATCSAQKSSIESLRQKCNLLESQLSSKEKSNASTLSDTNARLSVMGESIKTLELECQAYKTKNLDLLNDKKQLQGKVEECSNELQTLRMEDSKTKHEITDLQATIKNLRQAAEASARKEENMRLALLEATENNHTMTLKLEASIKSFTDLQANCDQKKSEIEQLEGAISTLETSNLKLRHSIDACWLHRLSYWLKKFIQSFKFKSPWALHLHGRYTSS